MALTSVPLDAPGWHWRPDDVTTTFYRGRRCIRFAGTASLVALCDGPDFSEGFVEMDMAVERDRSFHGLLWRARDNQDYESFFIRPHQLGNPDAVQYTPVFHGVSAWQLYTGRGFWARVAFPIERWFRLRVAFAGGRAEVYVGDMTQPVMPIGELLRPVEAGRVGILAGGPGLHVSRFAYSAGPIRLRTRPRRRPAVEGVIPTWWVSGALREDALPADRLTAGHLANRTWTRMESEPSGLVNLARVAGIRGKRNTVFARTTIRASREHVRPMTLGFSDRAVVYLNGRALFRGDDTYRSRDYRFLGTIGWYDTIHLPLVRGDNELVVAVSETFGGWGVQGRFEDLRGLTFGWR